MSEIEIARGGVGGGGEGRGHEGCVVRTIRPSDSTVGAANDDMKMRETGTGAVTAGY